MNIVKFSQQNISIDVFSEIFEERVKDWLNNSESGEFQIGDDEFQLVWNSDRCSYEVWLEGELLAWNDNAKDFLNVGTYIYNHRNLYNDIKNLLSFTDFKLTKSFQKWNCQQLRESYGEDYPNN